MVSAYIHQGAETSVRVNPAKAQDEAYSVAVAEAAAERSRRVMDGRLDIYM